MSIKTKPDPRPDKPAEDYDKIAEDMAAHIEFIKRTVGPPNTRETLEAFGKHRRAANDSTQNALRILEKAYRQGKYPRPVDPFGPDELARYDKVQEQLYAILNLEPPLVSLIILCALTDTLLGLLVKRALAATVQGKEAQA